MVLVPGHVHAVVVFVPGHVHAGVVLVLARVLVAHVHAGVVFVPGHVHAVVVLVPGHVHAVVVFVPGHVHAVLVLVPGHVQAVVVLVPGYVHALLGTFLRLRHRGRPPHRGRHSSGGRGRGGRLRVVRSGPIDRGDVCVTFCHVIVSVAAHVHAGVVFVLARVPIVLVPAHVHACVVLVPAHVHAVVVLVPAHVHAVVVLVPAHVHAVVVLVPAHVHAGMVVPARGNVFVSITAHLHAGVVVTSCHVVLGYAAGFLVTCARIIDLPRGVGQARCGAVERGAHRVDRDDLRLCPRSGKLVPNSVPHRPKLRAGNATHHEHVCICGGEGGHPPPACEICFNEHPAVRPARHFDEQHVHAPERGRARPASHTHLKAPSRQAQITPSTRSARKLNISTTAPTPSEATTTDHGYMNSISISNARNMRVRGYHRA